MAFRDVLSANEHLSKVLTEAEVPNLEDQVDFDLTDRRGWGSFGDVYVGQHNGISVCVKVLKDIPFTEDHRWEKFLRRLKREVTVWRQALHPNVVALLGWTSQVVRDKIRVTLISVWCDGGNIKDYLRGNPTANRHTLIVDVCRGLAYLHSRGIVHGDIKPVNIVVDTGLAKLCDFGLSSLFGDLSTYAQSTSIGGTTRFVSPELLTGVLEARNEGTDVWAFGCTSGEILCDECPYNWITNDWGLLSAVTKGPPYVWPDPDSFMKYIASCFAIDPERRTTSSELLKVLSPPNPALASLKMLLNVLQLDHLPLDWRYKPKESTPELVAEFNKTIPLPLQSICREWCDIVLRFPPTDPEILITFTQTIPVLLHWVAAMGIMGELDCALRGLYDLHNWAEDDSLKAHLNDIYRITLRSREAIIACPLSFLGGCHPFMPQSVLKSILHATSMKSPQGRIYFESPANKSWPALSVIPHAKRPRFSPQGRHLAFFSRFKKDVIVRDLVTGKTSNLGGDKNDVEDIAFSPDGSYLAFSTDRNVYVQKWETDGTDCVELKGDRFREIAFSTDGQCLACRSVDGISIWNITDRTSRIFDDDGSIFSGPRSIAFSPDNRYIALSNMGRGSIWDTAAQPITRVFEAGTGYLYRGVVFSPDGQFVSSVNHHCVHLWNVSTWTKDFTFEHPNKVNAVAFSPQGHKLASCLNNGTITLWDLTTRLASSVFKGKGDSMSPSQLGFSPDGRHLASYFDTNLRVWDIGNKTISTTTSLEHILGVSHLEFSPDVRYLALEFVSGFVKMLDLSNGTHETILAGHQEAVNCVAFSPNGCQFVSVSDQSVYVWKIETWTLKKIHQLYSSTGAEFLDDGRLLLIHRSIGENYWVDISTLTHIDPPSSWVPADVTTFPPPRFPVFLSDDNRSLCLKKGNQTIHFSWFPDSFQPSSEVAQYNDMVCLGGSSGEVLVIDLAGFELPDI